MQINDGTGRGYSAKVSENGRVSVDADDGCLAAAKRGELYSMTTTTHATKSTLTITATGGALMLLQNSSSSKKSLVVDSILVAGSAAGMHCSIVMNNTVGTISDAEDPLEIASTNTAYPTGSSATASGYVWNETNDGIGGLTGGNTVLRTQLPAGGPIELAPSGRFVVSPGGNLSVNMRLAGEGTAAIRFYEIDEHKGY